MQNKNELQSFLFDEIQFAIKIINAGKLYETNSEKLGELQLEKAMTKKKTIENDNLQEAAAQKKQSRHMSVRLEWIQGRFSDAADLMSYKSQLSN